MTKFASGERVKYCMSAHYHANAGDISVVGCWVVGNIDAVCSLRWLCTLRWVGLCGNEGVVLSSSPSHKSWMFLRIARNMALQYQMKPQEKPATANGFPAVRKEGRSLV